MNRISSTYPIYSEEEGEKKEEGQSPDPFMAKALKTRSIMLTGEINKALAERVVRSLLILEAESKEPIKVFIDSPGGDVDAGYAIYDMMRFVDAPIYAIGMGLIASAATLVLLAAPKENRLALPNSRYLIHQPLSGMRGVSTDIEIHAKELETIKAKINELYSTETGKPLAQVTKDTDRDYWMSATDAKDYGLITRIITTRKDLGL